MFTNSRLLRTTLALVVVGLALPALAGEGRIPIWQRGPLPAGDGKYVLTRDLLPGPGPAIVIPAGVEEVDIDLNGFTVWGDPGGGGNVIEAPGGHRSITIRNGSLRNQAPPGDGIQIIDTGKVVLEDLKILDAQDRGIFLFDVRSFALRRNIIVASNLDGLVIDGTFRITGVVEDNIFRDCGGGLTLHNGSSVAVTNNQINRTTGSHGIQLVNTRSALVAENNVEEAVDAGIYLEDVQASKFHNNTVVACGADGVFGVGATEDNLFLSNVSSANGGSGISMRGSRNQFDRNVLNANQGAGLRHPAGTSRNTFGRNTMRSNAGGGVGPCNNPSAPVCGGPHFCDEDPGAATGNESFGDNFAPGPC